MSSKKVRNTSFRRKIMVFIAAAVALSLLTSNIFALFSVQSLGNDSRALIDSSLRKANIEYLKNYLGTTRLRINQLLNQTSAELNVAAEMMQYIVDHPETGQALGKAVQSIPDLADRMKYQSLFDLPDSSAYPKGSQSGDWVQNLEPAPSVVGVWSYLLSKTKDPLAPVQATITKSKVFDLLGPALMKSGNNKLQVYYMGDQSAPIMRLTPYTDIAGTFDRLYNGHNNAAFWDFFFPGTVQGWNKWKKDPASQPFKGSDVTVSYPYLDAATGNYIVSFFRPLWSADRKSFAGAVAIDITLEQISNLIKDIHIANSGFAFLVLSDTNVLAMPKEGNAQLGLETTVDANSGVSGISRKLSSSTFESIRSLVLPKYQDIVIQELPLGEQNSAHTIALAQMEGMNFWAEGMIRAEYWTLGFIVPNQEIYAALDGASAAISDSSRSLVIMQIVTILISLIVILGLIRPITNRMTSGLIQLSDAARKIEKKDYNIKIDIQSNDEIGALARSFNNMASEILSYTTSLENIVQERTKDLAKANSEITALNARLATENLRLGAEVDVARRLQMMVLPKTAELQAVKELDIAAYMEPADEVGGDYYDVLQDAGMIKIGIGDVTGHGLESGVLMIMVQTVARTLLDSGQYNPVRFLTLLNEVLYKNIRRIDSEKNLSLSFLDYAKGKLTLTGQHEEVIIIKADGSTERIDTMDLGFPIGLEPHIEHFLNTREIEANPGDTVVLFTDGITEALNSSGTMFGIERFVETLVAQRHGTAEEMKLKVLSEIQKFIGTQKIYDDISLVIIKQK